MAKQSAARRVFRNRHGRAFDVPEFTATRAKNAFGALMNAAAEHGAVAVTKRNAAQAVLLSIDEYDDLIAKIPDPLDLLREEFDALVAKMQEPRSKRAVDFLFEAAPTALGRSSVKAARRSRRG